MKKGMYIFLKFIHSVKKKVDPDTNEMFVRAEVEFEDGLDMDFLLHKPLHLLNQNGFRIYQMKKLIKSYVAIRIGIY